MTIANREQYQYGVTFVVSVHLGSLAERLGVRPLDVIHRPEDNVDDGPRSGGKMVDNHAWFMELIRSPHRPVVFETLRFRKILVGGGGDGGGTTSSGVAGGASVARTTGRDIGMAIDVDA